MLITYRDTTFDLPASMIPQDGQALVTFLDEAMRAASRVGLARASGLPVSIYEIELGRHMLEIDRERREYYEAILAGVGEVTGERPKETHRARHPMNSMSAGQTMGLISNVPASRPSMYIHWEYPYGFGRWPH